MNKEELEHQLYLQQLQINRLLDITLAINNNVHAEGLYEMYRSFLTWELSVKRLALFLPKGNGWHCVVSQGVPNRIKSVTDFKPSKDLGVGMRRILSDSTKEVATLEGQYLPPYLLDFEIEFPVYHKEEPIAYAFIGGFDDKDFSKIQLISTITNIIAVAIENKRLFKRQIEKIKFEQELSLAAEMQKMLVPSELPKNRQFEVSAIYLPHDGVGGDYFDCFQLNNNRYMFCVADVAGKGFSASLLMANFQANLRALSRQTDNAQEFIKLINRSVQSVTKGERYITLFVCDYDVNTQVLRYINAGHVPPVFIQNGEVQRLEKGCSIIGFYDDLKRIEVGEITITDDALLLIYTDGVTDAANAGGMLFGEEEVTKFAEDNMQLGARSFNEKLMAKIETFKGEEDFPDDVTVLTARFFGKNA